MTREHGSYVTYVQGIDAASPPCRCDACRAANIAYNRDLRHRVTPAYVGASRARRHLAELAAAGVGLKTVATRSGLSQSTLGKIVYGDPARGTKPSKRIRPATEQRILSVTVRDARDGCRVPAGPTLANIETLRAKGWSKAAIARAIGQRGSGLQVAKSGQTVSARHARAIEALLDQPVPPRKPADRHTPAPAQSDPAAQPARVAHLDRIDRAARYELPTAVEPGEWISRGSCRRHQVPTWLFFPGRGDVETTRRARAVCATCPVADECLAYALATDASGIWGGTTGRERRDIVRASRKAIA